MRQPVRPGQLVTVVAEILLRVGFALCVAVFGREVFINDVAIYFGRARDISWSHLPYIDFLWEYPPVATLPLGLVPLSGRDQPTFYVLFVALTIALEYGSLLMLRRTAPESARSMSIFWTLTVLPLASIGYFRLDFLSVFFASMALWSMQSTRRHVTAVVVGFGAKLWPLVFGVAMICQRQYWRALYTSAGVVALVGAWWLFSPEGLKAFLDFRQGGGFQVESTPGMFLLLAERPVSLQFGAVVVSDAGWEWVQHLLQAIFFGVPVVATFIGWRYRNVKNMTALLGALVCLSLLSTRLLSPQFLVWLAPFVVLLWPRHKTVGLLFGASSFMTVFFIYRYDDFVYGVDWVIWTGVLRNALLAALTVTMFAIAFKGERAPALSP